VIAAPRHCLSVVNDGLVLKMAAIRAILVSVVYSGPL
jgi:hypothetical protein